MTPKQPPVVRLTRREIQVATAIMRGLKRVDIAKELVVDVRTIDYHQRSIWLKLGVSEQVRDLSRTERGSLLATLLPDLKRSR